MLLAATQHCLIQPAHAMDGPGAEGHHPGWAEQQSVLCTAAIAAAEARNGTLHGLLPAIARAESGRPVPAMYFDSKGAAVAWTRLRLQQGSRQVDVGCMQINLQSHPDAFASLDDAFDPAANAEYGARFLSRLQADAGGNWYIATGYYHSRTPDLADSYRQRVAAIADGRIPAASLGVPLYMRAIAQGTLRIPLAGGGVMRINLGRQPAARARRRLSPCEVAAVLGPYMAPRARSACSGARTADAALQAGYDR
jgi:hypothetical protein